MSSAPSVKPTFCMPAQMAVPSLCRGALTAWPQLQAALQLLRSTPGSAPGFALADGTAHQELGGPRQLTQRLAADPLYLARGAPPAHIYGRFAWLVQQVYQAARTVQYTLAELPALVSPATKRRIVDNGALVAAVLNRPGGLVPQARAVVLAAEGFAAHLKDVGGDLQTARAEYQAAGTQLSANSFGLSDGAGLQAAMQALGQTVVGTDLARQDLMRCEEAAAKVTAIAMIANMREAVQAACVAWETTAAQFEAVSRCPAVDLGTGSYLEEVLGASAAADQWKAFAGVVQAFLARVLVCGRRTL